MNDHPFNPQDSIPPCETLRETVQWFCWRDWLVKNCNVTEEEADGLLHSSIRIDRRLAKKLERGTGVSHQFWLNLQGEGDDCEYNENLGQWMQRRPKSDT